MAIDRQERQSLLEELAEYGNSDAYPLHVPGHKRRMPEEIASLAGGALGRAAMLDITEIDGFDDLHQAEGVLLAAQERAARVFGAEETFYLVNGSTAGILTAISAVVPCGGRVLVARNCHRSVYHALFLRDLDPVYLYPGQIEGTPVADAILPEQVAEALEAYPGVGAVVITSPTYDGVVSDVAAIAALVHEKGIPLIVDAAHGAHFGFGSLVPESPVRLGADLTIMSLHKTLPALTQTALLHVCGNLVDRDRLRQYERIYQTSSPSYVLMASMDACVGYMEEKGDMVMDAFVTRMRQLSRKLESLKSLKLFGADMLTHGHMKALDPGRLLIGSRQGELTGVALYQELRRRYHLQLEMACDTYATAVMTPWDSPEGEERLVAALREMDGRLEQAEDKWTVPVRRGGFMALPAGEYPVTLYPPLPRAMSVREACESVKRRVLLADAAGGIAAEAIQLYPPGIPVAVPGEILTKEAVALLKRYLDAGLQIQGVTEGGYVWQTM